MAKIIDSLVSDAVKRFVMNPEYMRAAWMREMENNLLFGMTTDEMLMRGLDRDSHQLPHFAGAHVYPVFPGAAAMCGFPPLLLMPSSSYNHTLSFQGARSVCRQAACICIQRLPKSHPVLDSPDQASLYMPQVQPCFREAFCCQCLSCMGPCMAE